MAESTWTWNGGSAAAASLNWTLTQGPGNPQQHPKPGDTAIIPGGTVVYAPDHAFQDNTIEIGGTAGAAATLTIAGDDNSNLAKPSTNATTLIDSAVPGNETAEASVLNAGGITVNKGTILADGPAGSAFTINVAPTLVGTATVPGYFTNYGTIIADAGNTLTINIAGTSDLFNPGTVIANGGTVVIDAAAGAIDSGYAQELGVAAIQNGGTIETNASYTTADSGISPTFLFLDAATGDTLKIADVTRFDGRISGFQAGDTIDLGTAMAVGEIVYNRTLGVVYLDNARGTILASLVLSPIGMSAGTYAVNALTGAAGGLIVSLGADGDTLLTTTGSRATWNNTSGSWQTAADWSGGAIPTAASSVAIGLDSSAAFTVTTGAAPATAAFLSLYDPNALLEVTSATALPIGTVTEYAGTLDVTAGNTLSTALFRSYSAADSLVVDDTGVLDLTGRANSTISNDGTISQSVGGTIAAQFDGNVLVDGGTIDAGPGAGQTGGVIEIGQDGDGIPATVTVDAGGMVTDTYAILASDPTSFGELTLSGAGTRWTDALDPNDPSNDRGDIFVGYNNEASNTPTGVAQPPDAGTARLTVENGATLTDPRAYIGYSADSAGSATIESGGLWNIGLAAGGYLNMAQSGQASLSILAGGTVNVGNVGTFLSSGSAYLGGGIGVGYNAGASGTITVDGAGAELSTLNGLALGKGGQGILSILNGGTVSVNANGIGIGQSAGAGSSGTLTVGGTGAAAFLNFGTAAGDLTVGYATQGTLIVSDNGTINLDGRAGDLIVGVLAGGSGVVTVSGSSAALSLRTQSLWVGAGGSGELSVLNGARVSVGEDLLIGQYNGDSGNVDIENATLTVANNIQFNSGENDVLTVGPAASVSVSGGIIGDAGDVVNQFAPIDPEFDSGVTTNIAFTGTQTYLAYVDNAATFNIAQGFSATLETPTINQGVKLSIGAGTDTRPATLVLNAGSISADSEVRFNNPLGTLVIGIDTLGTIDTHTLPETMVANPDRGVPLIGNFDATIANVQAGDKIVVDTTQAARTAYTPGNNFIDVVDTADPSDVLGALLFDTATNAANASNAGDVSILDTMLCFLPGTLIRNPNGQTAVERLNPGDLVLTATGQARPVTWIGEGRVLATRGRRNAATPIIIRKGAFAPNVPHDDLRVTKGHSFLLDNVLIPAEFLVNHRSILWDDRAQEVSVYHVELETHDILLANSAPAESYRDDGNRWLFRNANTGWDQPPKLPCAPVLTGGPIVDQIWRRLLDQCGPRPGVPLTDDPDLHLLVDGVRVDAATQHDGVSVFTLTRKPRQIQIVSRSAAPQELGTARDPRCLGVAVRRLAVRQGPRFQVIPAGDKRLSDGFHAIEPGSRLHWTNGNAAFPIALFDGFGDRTEVVIHVAAAALYPDDGRVSVAA